jgi:hypothetical protein
MAAEDFKSLKTKLASSAKKGEPVDLAHVAEQIRVHREDGAALERLADVLEAHAKG